MALNDAHLDLLRGERSEFTPGHPADDALLALLVHVAFSDGVVDDQELDFLTRVLPGRGKEALRSWVAEVGREPLDLEAIAEALVEPDERWRCMRFAATMAWKDGYVAQEEQRLLTELSQALEMPEGAVERVLDETSPRTRDEINGRKIREAVQGIRWDAVQLAGGEICSPDLLAAAPEGLTLVARIGLDNVEMLGLYEEGVVARFRQGCRFMHWSELVSYSRGFGLGSAVELHTDDGRSWSLVDSRLNGISVLIDRLFGYERKVASGVPQIEQRSGE